LASSLSHIRNHTLSPFGYTYTHWPLLPLQVSFLNCLLTLGKACFLPWLIVLPLKACTGPLFHYIFTGTSLFWPAKTFLTLKPFSSRGADRHYTSINLYCLSVRFIRRVSAKFVLRQLTADQMECRLMVAGDLSSSPRKAFLSWPKHLTLQISLRVTFGCSLIWKWASRWRVSQTMEDIKSNATAELQKIPKEAFQRCFQQWQDRWNKCVCVCVCARVLPWRWLCKRPTSYHISAIPHFREISERLSYDTHVLLSHTQRTMECANVKEIKL
jgi:hypothetical protein